MFDTTMTDELLATTRAVRRRLDFDRPVDPQVILECIALTQQAPTGTNAQSWRWVVVTEPVTKAALAEIYRGGCLSYLEKGAVEEKDPQTRHVYESALQLATTIEQVPALVIPCIERRFDGARAHRRGDVVRLDPAGGVELPPRPPVARPRLGVDDRAPLGRIRGGADPRHPRHRHAGGDVPGGPHHRDRLPAGDAAAARDGHVLGVVGRER